LVYFCDTATSESVKKDDEAACLCLWPLG
jgi:hypothetical protein